MVFITSHNVRRMRWPSATASPCSTAAGTPRQPPCRGEIGQEELQDLMAGGEELVRLEGELGRMV